jgi:uncharacterized membrane protein YhaH (DUF805 family)
MSDEFNKEQTPPEYQAQPQPEQAPPQYGQAPPPQYGQASPQQPYGYIPEAPMTGFFEAYKSYWMNYVNFNDRTSRAGYWWVYLMNMIIETILCIVLVFPMIGAITAAIMGNFYAAGSTAIFTLSAWLIIPSIWALANLLPGLALMVRRLHDTGKSWVWMLLFLIPFAGFILWIVFMVTGTKYPPENRFFHLPRQG